MKGLFGTIGSLNGNGLCSSVDVRNGAVCRLQAVIADSIDLVRGVLAPNAGVVDGHFAAFRYPVGCIDRSMRSIFGSIDSYLAGVMKSVLGAVFRFDHQGLGTRVDLLHRAIHRMNHILRHET